MKYYYLSIAALFITDINAQDIQSLFESIPPAHSNSIDAFKSAELEWESMVLDNDSIFQRAKSWAPGGALKSFSLKLDKLQASIDRASENNSFSLTAPPSIGKEMMTSLEQIGTVRTNISNIWNEIRGEYLSVNSNFIVPNELEYGCDQIAMSSESLNAASVKLNNLMTKFNQKSAVLIADFQTRFNELNKTKHPMVSNQLLEEMTNLLNILFEITNNLNFHYKNMVETRMAWNNAFCK